MEFSKLFRQWIPIQNVHTSLTNWIDDHLSLLTTLFISLSLRSTQFIRIWGVGCFMSGNSQIAEYFWMFGPSNITPNTCQGITRCLYSIWTCERAYWLTKCLNEETLTWLGLIFFKVYHNLWYTYIILQLWPGAATNTLFETKPGHSLLLPRWRNCMA